MPPGWSSRGTRWRRSWHTCWRRSWHTAGVEAGTPGELGDPCYNYETQFGQVVDCSMLTDELRAKVAKA